MAITIDWGTRVITVPQSFCTLVGGSVYNLDTYAFHIALRELEESAEGIVNPKTHKHNTEVTLGGVNYARIIEIINGYTVTFEETGTPWAVNLVGSNNNILDVTNLGTVQVRSNNSAGLVNVPEIQNMIYNYHVAIDAVRGVPGTIYPIGSVLEFSNNINDARQIAQSRGFTRFGVYSDLTISSGDLSAGFDFFGTNPFYVLNCLPNADLTGCSVETLTVTGELDGLNTLRYCAVSNISKLSGYVEKCGLTGDVEIIGDTSFMECYSIVSGNGYPTITVNGGSLIVRDYHGSLAIAGVTANSHSIEVYGGRLVIDATCTGGEIIIRGEPFEITNNSTGTIIINQSAVKATWSDPKALTVGKFIGLQ